MKIYISGKITGDPDYKIKFKAAEQFVKNAGFEVINPCSGKPDGMPWEWYMKHDLRQMLECDALYVLDDWHDSTGASLEVSLASELKMKIYGGEWGELPKRSEVKNYD